MTEILRSPNGAIANAVDLEVEQVVHQRVVCPACESMVFEMWPEGWDAHAASRCGGVSGSTIDERKADFRGRFGHLFR